MDHDTFMFASPIATCFYSEVFELLFIACFLERFNGFSSTIRHTELCQSTCQEPTEECGTSPEDVQHKER